MRWQRWMFVTGLFLPAFGLAQGRGSGGIGGAGGMGGAGGGRGGRGGAEMSRAAPKFPAALDLEKLNPAALLVDKRRKLALGDTLVGALRGVERQILERNAALLARYDSLRRDYKPPSGEARTAADDKDRERSLGQMRAMQNILEQLIERRRSDVTDALSLVPDASRRAAGELLDKQDRDFLERIPSSRAIPGGDEGRRGRPGPP